MNWPLWKRELRGRSWWRLAGILSAAFAAGVMIQLVRVWWAGGPTQVTHNLFSLWIFRLWEGFQFLPALFRSDLGLSRTWNYLIYSGSIVSFAFYGAIGLLAAILTSFRFTRHERDVLAELHMTPAPSSEGAIAKGVVPFLTLWVFLVGLMTAECFPWNDRLGLPYATLGTGHSYWLLSHRVTGESLLLTYHHSSGLILEVLVRLMIISALCVTAALLPLATMRGRLLLPLALAAATATVVGAMPEVTRYVLMVNHSPREGLNSPFPLARPWNVGIPPGDLIEGVRTGPPQTIEGISPNALDAFEQEQRNEERIIWISYLVPTALWLLFWLWWAKRFFLRSFLRE